MGDIYDHKYTLEQNEVLAVVVSPDSQFIATANGGNSMTLWAANTGKRDQEFTFLSKDNTDISSIAFSPNGGLIATICSHDGTVNIFDRDMGRIRRTFKHDQTQVIGGPDPGEGFYCLDSISFSPDSTLVMSASRNGRVMIWDIAANTSRVFEYQKQISCAIFFPDGQSVTVAKGDGTIETRCLDESQSGQVRQSHSNEVTQLAFYPDGKHMASVGYDKKLVMASVGDDKSATQFVKHLKDFPSAMACSLELLAIGYDDGFIEIMTIDGQRTIQTFMAHSDGVTSLAISPNDLFLVTACNIGDTKVWAVKDSYFTSLASVKSLASLL